MKTEERGRLGSLSKSLGVTGYGLKRRVRSLLNSNLKAWLLSLQNSRFSAQIAVVAWPAVQSLCLLALPSEPVGIWTRNSCQNWPLLPITCSHLMMLGWRIPCAV